jgi:hypothetical protein
MSHPFTLGAQVVIDRSLASRFDQERVLADLRQRAQAGSLDLLAVGGAVLPGLYRALADKKTRPVEQVYLWHPVLADYPGLAPDHLVVDYQGEPARGLSDYQVQESSGEEFRFACPNNPAARQVVFGQLEELLARYEFDGVFLDKMRFPSPANGLAELLSCFCEHCCRRAAEQALDLAEVRALLQALPSHGAPGRPDASLTSTGAAWLDDLLAGWPLLHRWMRFRAESITRLVADLQARLHWLGRRLALDLFSPGLAPLVGQDYRALAPYAAWCKPMIYQSAKGPAGLRLEIPQLAQGLEQFLRAESGSIWAWAQNRLPALAGASLERIAAGGLPLAVVEAELRAAIQLMAPTPVYLGVEAVSLAAFDIHTTPESVAGFTEMARRAGAAGVVLSWDLLNMPPENIRAARCAAPGQATLR